MIKNFLKMAFRNLTGRKGYTVVNLAGLAIGMSCCLLIFEYVSYERSFDNFHEYADRIYRVQDIEYQKSGVVVPCASAMPALAPAIRREIPEVEKACRLAKVDMLLTNERQGTKFRESGIYFADADVLKVFHLPLMRGNQETALDGAGKIILSETEAKKYFGLEEPLGKVLTIISGGHNWPLKVDGIFSDFPKNSHIKFTVLVSYPTRSQMAGTYGKPNDPVETSWGWTDYYTYILLKEGASPASVQRKLSAIIDKNYNNLPDNRNQGDSYELNLMPLREIHLNSHYTEEAEANGDGKSVTVLFLIGFFIIVIAWINYVNLGTARSMDRAREVGVRKVMGALKQGLVGQFLLESLLLNLVALVLAIVIVLLLNPLFGRLAGRPLPILFSLPWAYWGYFIFLFLTGSFISGFYPALVMSRYKPVTVLKGIFKNTSGGRWLRKGLIIGQFTASIILIAGTIVVYLQVRFMRSQELGVNIDQTLVVTGARSSLGDSAYNEVYQAFKDDILRTRGVRSMTASSDIMGHEILWSTSWWKLRGGDKQVRNLFHLGVDDDFIKNYGLKMLAGRAFSKNLGNEKKEIILNETAAKAFGFASPKDAIGVLLSGGQRGMDSMEVIGVAADYHNEGLQKAIQPLVLIPGRDRRAYYSVKMEGKDPSSVVSEVKKLWDSHFPGDPFEYFFLDEYFNRQYAENQRFGQVFLLFSLLAIGIACFGLLGLSAYNVLQRTKEIGIRKVLGASVQSLVFKLSGEFLVLVLVAFIIAIPLAQLAMSDWLQGFAYRIRIGWWIYAIAGLSAMAIALLTLSYQAVRAALTSPARSLRTE